MSRITWGVNGYGVKYYLCSHCELEYGTVKPESDCGCDKSKPKYHNRDKQAP